MDQQKNACKFESRFQDALDGVLSGSGKEELDAHLAVCPSCRRLYRETAETHRLLLGRVRPAPSDEVLSRYHTALRSAFRRPPVWHRVMHRLKEGFASRRTIRQIAVAACLILIGVYIGWFLPGTRPGVGVVSYTPAVSSLSEDDIRFISDFLTLSEIWLIEMIHADITEDADRETLTDNRELARRLLVKSKTIDNKLSSLNSTSMLRFMNRLEMILLETTGAKDQGLEEAIREIRTAIHETSLLREVRNIQRLVEAPHREGV